MCGSLSASERSIHEETIGKVDVVIWQPCLSVTWHSQAQWAEPSLSSHVFVFASIAPAHKAPSGGHADSCGSAGANKCLFTCQDAPCKTQNSPAGHMPQAAWRVCLNWAQHED